MVEWCLPEAHKFARVGPSGNGSVYLWFTPDTSFLCPQTPIQPSRNESRLERQLKEQPDQAAGIHANGSQRGGVIHAPKFVSVFCGGGGQQEGGEIDRGEQNAISGKDKRVGSGGFGMQTGIGRRPGTQERVTRGLESTPLCGLVEGPRGAFLKGEDKGDSRLPLKSIMEPISYRPLKQLRSPGLYSRTYQTSNELTPNQGDNTRTVEGGGEAA